MRRVLPGLFIALSTFSANAQIIYDEGSLISELNVQEEADAFPWLSADGLRLYYSKTFEGNISHIAYAVRENVSAPFVLMDTYLAGATTDGTSCWLMPDELTIYFTSSTSLRKATRSSIGEQFGQFVTVSLTGVSLGNLKGPSLTPDGSQLIIRDFSIDGFRKFISTGPNSFASSGTFDPGLPDQGGGKMDHTGLAFYFDGGNTVLHTLFRMTRTSLSSDFSNMQELNGSVFSNDYSWIQPTVAEDETVMVLVRNITNMWDENELFRSHGTEILGIDDLWQERLMGYPNPAVDQIDLFIPGSLGDNFIEIMIFDMQGRTVHSSIKRRTFPHRQDLSHLSQGTYILAAMGNGRSYRTTVIIER